MKTFPLKSEIFPGFVRTTNWITPRLSNEKRNNTYWGYVDNLSRIGKRRRLWQSFECNYCNYYLCIQNEFKDYSNCLDTCKPEAGVFWLIPSMGKSRWVRMFTTFGKRILTKPHELKWVRTTFVWRYQENGFWQGCFLGVKKIFESTICNCEPHSDWSWLWKRAHTLAGHNIL